VIIDHKIGNANQAIAVAKSIGANFQIKHLVYNFLSTLPNRFKFNSLLGIDLKASSSIEPEYPDIIISSGRKTALVSKYIKTKSPKTFTIHLMNPDLSFNDFNLVCLPLHDLAENHKSYQNIIYTIGAPSYLDKAKMQEEQIKLKNKLQNPNGPFISVMLGGKTKNGDYSFEEVEWLINKASILANQISATLLITTSRRTNQNISSMIEKLIKAPYYFYNWNKENSKDNPYLAYLSLSDYFIVTGDSVSICSEALATGKPVYIYRKDEILYKKHIKFLDYLIKLGYTKILNNETNSLEKWNYPPLQEAEKICKVIKEKLNDITHFSS
jgi:mitochondrial fission protein ELM1